MVLNKINKINVIETEPTLSIVEHNLTENDNNYFKFDKKETFLAFVDISGFRKYMENKTAGDVLDRFFQYGYEIIDEDERLYGIFVSDSGIIFIDTKDNEGSPEDLKLLLKAVKKLNRKLISDDDSFRFSNTDGIVLTSSIAYGLFEYEDRMEFDRIRKTLFHGNAYLLAYLDNEHAEIKLKPGECRILIDTLNNNIIDSINHGINNRPLDDVFKYLKVSEDEKYYYFYWMVDDYSEINAFEDEYHDAYEKRYELIKNALKSKFK